MVGVVGRGDLADVIGMSETDASRYRSCRESGDTGECLRLLRRRRSELVVALHEAQRPIDVVDLAIRELEAPAPASRPE